MKPSTPALGAPLSPACRRWLAAVASILAFASAAARAATPEKLERRCHAAFGETASACLRDYSGEVRRCRDVADASCEEALRAPDGTLAELLAASEAPLRKACTGTSAQRITFSLGVDTLVPYAADACRKTAEDFLAVAYADTLGTLTPEALACQRRVAGRLARVRDRVVQAAGKCNAAEFAGHDCNRSRRDKRVAKALAGARHGIVKRCGETFDQLDLVAPAAGDTLEARVDALLDRVVLPARNFALRVYPPLNLGPTASFGAMPVGVRTLDLVDTSRLNVASTGPRPVRVEVYYPSTLEAVTDVPRDVVRVFGVDLFPTPTFRDVARAPGRFPVILYSHGHPGIRFESLLLAVHLASHGYIVVSPDHHGDTLFETPDTIEHINVDRPRDLTFLIDQLFAFDSQSGNVFEDAIDATRIGATGHSYGGYTVMALAVGSFTFGTFTDPRVNTILPLDASAFVFDADAPAIYATVHVPILLLTASLLSNLGNNQAFFDGVPSGPSVVGLGEVLGAGHLSFPDTCAVPEALRGFVVECEPVALPWLHVRYIENYLALNFFDAALRNSPEALARLDPAALADAEELAYQRK